MVGDANPTVEAARDDIGPSAHTRRAFQALGDSEQANVTSRSIGYRLLKAKL